MRWSNAQLNCYYAIRSGLLCHKGESLRFLTLTSVVDMKRSITDCFKVLVLRVKRMTPSDFVSLGYIPESKLLYFFPDLSPNDFLSFEYLFVLTSEGANGVLHILYFGDYLNEKWLKDAWEEITGGARQLFIENIKESEKDFKEVARYIVNQNKIFGYVAGQSKYVRHSYSSDWVYRGWRSDFNRLMFVCSHKSKFRNSVLTSDFLRHWDDWLCSRRFYTKSLDSWIVDNV